MRAFLQCFSQLRESRVSAGKFTIVQCLSHMRSQFERGTAGLQVRCCWRDAAGDQQRGKHAHTQAAMQAYTQVAMQTHT